MATKDASPPLSHTNHASKATSNKSNTYFQNISQVLDNAWRGFGNASILATNVSHSSHFTFYVLQDPGQSGKTNIQTFRMHTQMESKNNRNRNPKK